MSTYSPNRRGSIISNCTNDSDIASDKTPISGQPKKLRKQINNDEFKQNYFELNLSTSTGVQVLAFQPGSETTPKKRKRSSRRKSVPAAEEDSNNDSPRIETKQTSKKRKQSIAPSVDTPSEDICFSEDALQAMISSCDHELFENILQSQQQQQFNTPTNSKMEDETPKLEIKSAFNSKLKRNLACSTTNIQTTSSCSFSLKNSPETPNSSSRNRSTSNSLPIHQILNNNDSNTIRKRSNSCVSISQLSNNNNNTTQSNLATSASQTTLSPPERLMAKEMKLNVYLNLRRESENCGNSQNSPMTCSTQSGGGMSCTTPQPVQDLVLARGSVAGLMSTSSAPVMAPTTAANTVQRFDSNNFSNMFRDEVFWSNMNVAATQSNTAAQSNNIMQAPIDFNTGSNGALTDLACRQYVNSFFAENPRVHNECGGLDPSLFETLFNSVQGSDAFDPTQQFLQPQEQLESSRVVIPELSMDDLQTMDPSQLQSLIDYLARLQSNIQSMQSPPEQNQSGGSSLILNQQQQQQQNELLFDKDEFQDFFQSF